MASRTVRDVQRTVGRGIGSQQVTEPPNLERSFVPKAAIMLLDEYKGHPSVRDLMADGRQIVTF